MPWKIIISVTGGPERGARHEFVQDKIIIGRSRKADVVLNDAAVGVTHCQIQLSDDSVEVEDLMSKNNTFVNEVAVERAPLKTGDRIQIGRTELEIRIEPLTAEIPLTSPLYPNIFVAGYGEQERNFLAEEAKRSLLVPETQVFSTGEELLVEAVRWFEQKLSPGLFILDLKMPIINGINAAISLRAYERAYQTEKPAPIVFFCDPPDTEAFRKVLAFCTPSLYYPRQLERADFDHQVKLLFINLKRAPL